MDEQWRGTLYPTRLPQFHRASPPPGLENRVRWFWIPEWNLAPGRVSRQELLPFPALNLVIQPDGVSLAGPATRRSHQDLRGSGWAVGMLLRPAAVSAFTADPGALRDTEVSYDAPDLLAAVSAAMSPAHSQDPASGDAGASRPGTSGAGTSSPGTSGALDNDGGVRRRALAVAEAAAWLQSRIPALTEEADLANRLEQLIQDDSELTRVDQVAEKLGVSVRLLQRLAKRYVGLPPLAMIRRYRLQEAVERLRTEPGVSIADIAADLGYADHAHLASDFREVLGFTPSGYRRSAEGR